MMLGGKEGAERLRAFVVARRKHMGLSQQKVAERSGVSMGWIGMLESSRLKNPPLKDTLLKLSKGLRLPVEDAGALYNFMNLYIVGSFSDERAQQVASGEVDTAAVLSEAVHEGKGLRELAPGEPDMAYQIFSDRQDADADLALVLSRIERNVKAAHFETIKVILQTLFLEGPDDQAPAPLRAKKSSSAGG